MKIKNHIFVLTIFSVAGLLHANPYHDAKRQYEQQQVPEFVQAQLEPQSTLMADEMIDLGAMNIDVQLPEVDFVPQYEQLSKITWQQVVADIEPWLLGARAETLRAQLDRSSELEMVQTRLSLFELINITFARNSKINAAFEAWQQSLAQYSQSAYLDGILRQYNSFTKRQNLLLGGMRPGTEVINDSFPFPGLSALRGDVIQADIALAKFNYAITVRDVLTQTKVAFFDYIYIIDAIKISHENQMLLEHMLEVASTQYESGNISYSDVIKARIELSDLINRVLTLENQRATIVTRLNTLMNRSPQASLGNPQAPNWSVPSERLDRLYELAENYKQEIKQADLRIRRTELMIDMTQEMNRPDPSLGASYVQYRGQFMQEDNKGSASFNPLPQPMLRPWFGQRESYVFELIKQKDKLNQQRIDIENQTKLAVKTTHFEMDTALREARLYETTLIPEARQALEIAEVDFVTSRIGFLDYLDAQRTWLNFNLKTLQAQLQLSTSVAQLEQSVGKALVSRR